MVSMTDLFLSTILSFNSNRQFFMLVRIFVIRCMPSTNKTLVSSVERYPLSAYSLPLIDSISAHF